MPPRLSRSRKRIRPRLPGCLTHPPLSNASAASDITRGIYPLSFRLQEPNRTSSCLPGFHPSARLSFKPFADLFLLLQFQIYFIVDLYLTTSGRFCQISIHTPARGATQNRTQLLFRPLYFNPRSHAGSDASSASKVVTVLAFQSTLSRGERLQATYKTVLAVCISIHALTRGATVNISKI